MSVAKEGKYKMQKKIQNALLGTPEDTTISCILVRMMKIYDLKQFLTITIIDNFYNYGQFLQLWTILTFIETILISLTILTILDIFGQFFTILTVFEQKDYFFNFYIFDTFLQLFFDYFLTILTFFDNFFIFFYNLDNF